jgi:hypothetical protein
MPEALDYYLDYLKLKSEMESRPGEIRPDVIKELKPEEEEAVLKSVKTAGISGFNKKSNKKGSNWKYKPILGVIA